MFHGVAHDVSNHARNLVIAVVPHLHTVQHNLAESPDIGMDTVCWILCKAQQECFHWASEVTNGVAGAAPVNLADTLGEVQTHGSACFARRSCLCGTPW